MKPREFDDLVRQKFDEGNFEYNPGNWHRLDAQLEGQSKKKSVVIWWLPLMAIAAAVTVSMGFATYMRQAEPVLNNAKESTIAKVNTKPLNNAVPTNAINEDAIIIPENATTEQPVVNNTEEIANAATPANEVNSLGINSDYLMNGNANNKVGKNGRAETQAKLAQIVANTEKKTMKTDLESRRVFGTFDEETTEHKRSAQISLAGGLNMGSKSSGFAFGATGRKMVSDRVYIEGDIAIAGSNNTQRTAYLSEAGTYASAKMSSSSNRTTTTDPTLSTQANAPQNSVVVADRSFNMYYAQITPSIGYQVAKRFSVGMGPDFQQALSDTRPAASTLDRNNVQVTPMFDMGVMGKAEFLLNNRIRAAFLYREGINNIVTPMDKYVERSYMQVQIKYSVFRNM